MCRYANVNYKSKFACFQCRKSFKKVTLADYLKQHVDEGRTLHKMWPYPPERGTDQATIDQALRRYYQVHNEIYAAYCDEVGVCPQCSGRMQDLGRDFKAPKQSDISAWRAVQGAHRLGHQFHTCGCDGPGFIPSSKVEYRRYLTERLARFQARYESATSEPASHGRAERAGFWADRVARVRVELDLV